MEVLASFLILLALVSSLLPTRELPEDEMALYVDAPGIQHALKYEVKPGSAAQFENIVKQQFDYSCGSAALATLLNHYLGESFTEEQVIQGMMEYGDLGQIQHKRAFSLLDMKRFVAVLGYEGAGYAAELEDLEQLGKPCIVPIKFFGYNHFVVYRGMYGGHLFFADPFMGNISFTVSEFKEMWDRNIVFIVSDQGVTMDALLLEEEDLRFVEIARTSDILTEHARSNILKQQQRFMETIGKIGEDDTLRYQFKTMSSN